MGELAAGHMQNDGDEDAAEADAMAAGMVARARWLMIISGLTTLLAIAAVVGVIGYRVYSAGGSGAGAEGIIVLPKGARLIASRSPTIASWRRSISAAQPKSVPSTSRH